MRFFLIDRITQWLVGTSAEAVKNVALSEDFFDDHFPRHPVMPGVLILEGMAQLSGLLLEASLPPGSERGVVLPEVVLPVESSGCEQGRGWAFGGPSSVRLALIRRAATSSLGTVPGGPSLVWRTSRC